MNRKMRVPLISVIIALILAGVGAAAWFVRPQGVMERALEVLEGGESVRVEEFDLGGVSGFRFSPENVKADAGLIFYPGARVPARAYAPQALGIAGEGYSVYLVSVPVNLAVLGWKKAGKVISARKDIESWVVGGHSMGGAMAARFVASTDYRVAGLVLWASYPPEGASFPGSLDVLSITGTRDEIINRKKIARSREQLPPETEFVEIVGGNHSQFGWYGFQTGDGQARISRKEQQDIVVAETVGLLEKVMESRRGSSTSR